jgi:hypothetical protein
VKLSITQSILMIIAHRFTDFALIIPSAINRRLGEIMREKVMSFNNSNPALAIPVVDKVLSKWKCSDKVKAELLGFVSEEAFKQVTSNPYDHIYITEQVERMSYILNIYRSLHTLFSKSKQADEWVNKPNTAKIFGGRPALGLMTQSPLSNLELVSNYLKSLF